MFVHRPVETEGQTVLSKNGNAWICITLARSQAHNPATIPGEDGNEKGN